MEIEPWNYRADDSRLADTLPTFIIFCEDGVCEPVYFKCFETERIKVNIVGDQKSSIRNVINAIAYCQEKQLLENCDGVMKLKDGDPQVWCVFDRDIARTGVMNPVLNAEFNTAIQSATTCGINTAWSNDSFELWVLLHYEEVDHTIEQSQHRDTYYARLTDIIKATEEPNVDLEKALKHASFSYKKDLKKEANFRSIVHPIMLKNTLKAIERAKKLEQVFAQPNMQNHEKSPCTQVHHLVGVLLALGKKEIPN